MKEKLTFKDYFNVAGALAIVGFFGGMDCGEPIGKGLLYIAVTVLVMCLVNRKKKRACPRFGAHRTGNVYVGNKPINYYSTQYLKGQGVGFELSGVFKC